MTIFEHSWSVNSNIECDSPFQKMEIWIEKNADICDFSGSLLRGQQVQLLKIYVTWDGHLSLPLWNRMSTSSISLGLVSSIGGKINEPFIELTNQPRPLNGQVYCLFSDQSSSKPDKSYKKYFWILLWLLKNYNRWNCCSSYTDGHCVWYDKCGQGRIIIKFRNWDVF